MTKCAERVTTAWESVKSDLDFYMEYGTDFEAWESNREFPEEPLREDYISEESFQADHDEWSSEESIASQWWERGDFHDYGLAFDYVAPGTFGDQREGYFRFQISWGGPSKEIRLFAQYNGGEYDYSLYRAEFWYLDWFDGAKRDVTHDPAIRWLWEFFLEIGSVNAAFHEGISA